MTEDLIDVSAVSRLKYLGIKTDLQKHRPPYVEPFKRWLASKPAVPTWKPPGRFNNETVVFCCRDVRGEAWPRQGCIEANEHWIPDRLLTRDHDVETLRGLARCVFELLRDPKKRVLCADAVGWKKAPAVVCAFLLIHTKVQTLADAWAIVRERGCEKAAHTDGGNWAVPYGSGTRPNPLSIALEKICAELSKDLGGTPVFTPADVPALGTKRPRSPEPAAASTSQAFDDDGDEDDDEHSPRSKPAPEIGVPSGQRT